MKEAKHNQLLRELKQIQLGSLAAHGGEMFMAKQSELINDLKFLTGIDKKQGLVDEKQQETWDNNWAWLKAKKRG